MISIGIRLPIALALTTLKITFDALSAERVVFVTSEDFLLLAGLLFGSSWIWVLLGRPLFLPDSDDADDGDSDDADAVPEFRF